MRRFLGKFSFLFVILLVAAFAYGTYAITKPVTRAEKDALVHGTLRPAAALLPDAPFVRYVALHRGRPAGAAGSLVDDVVAAEDGAFELRADAVDGTRFYVLGRIETAREELWCETVELPLVRHDDEREWVESATQKPLGPVRITVDRSTRCD